MKQLVLCTFISALGIVGCSNVTQDTPPVAKPQYRVTIAIEDTAGVETTKIFDLLTKHLAAVGITVFATETDIPNRQITFDISDNGIYGPDRLKTELTRFQSFGIWETYQNTDEKIAAPFVAMFGKYNLADKFNPSITIYNQHPSAIIGDAARQDIPLLDSIFNLQENLESLPNDVELRWSLNSSSAEEPDHFELYALKKSITGEGFMTSRDLQMVEGGKDEGGYFFISLEFKPEKKATFAAYTRKAAQNTGAIAFVLGDRVLMAPVVINEISGGKASISGGFDFEETAEIVTELKLGSLPIALKIVDFKEL